MQELVTTDTVNVGNTGSAGIGQGMIGVETLGVGSGSLEIADSGGGDFIQIPVNAEGRNIQVQIEDNTTDKSWEMNALIFQFKKINTMYQPTV